MVHALKSGFGQTGAHIGSSHAGEADLFRDEMVQFWRATMAP